MIMIHTTLLFVLLIVALAALSHILHDHFRQS